MQYPEDLLKEKMKSSLIKLNDELYFKVSDFTVSGVIIHKEGNVKFINEKLTEMTGYTENDLIGKNIFDVVEFRAQDKEKIQNMINNEESGSYEIRLTNMSTGRDRPILLVPKITTLEGESIRAVLLQDLSKQKETEKRLQYYFEFEKTISQISRNFINCSINEIDQEITKALKEIGQFADVDRSYLFQYDFAMSTMSNTHEWVNKNIKSFIDELQNIPISVFSWLNDKILSNNLVYFEDISNIPEEATNFKRELKREEIKSIILVPLSFEGEILGFIGFDSVNRVKKWYENSISLLNIIGEIFVNALDRKSKENRIISSENKFRTLFEDSNDAIYITSIDGEIIECNQAFLDIFGYKREDIESLNAIDLYHIKEDRTKFQKSIIKNGAVKNLDLELVTKQGEIINCLVNAQARYDENNNPIGYQGIIRDVTDEIKAKESILRSQKLESIGILAAGVAHDFNNILMGIMGYANIALKNIDDPYIQNMIQSILKNSDRAAALTRQLLSYSGRGHFNTKNHNLNAIISELKQLIEISIRKDLISLHYELDDNISTINVDKTQIGQVLLNLVTNASEAIEGKGQIWIRTNQIELTESDLIKKSIFVEEDIKSGLFVKLEVEDTGTGMANTETKNIFDPFYTTKFQGRGLGLAAVLGIIKAHRGLIEVESEPEIGSKFMVYFPVVETGKSSSLESNKTEKIQLDLKYNRAIVCDDQSEVRTVIKLMLDILDIKATLTSNGPELIEKLDEDSNYDVVILDYTMPNMSGMEVYEEIRNINNNIPVIFSTGLSQKIISFEKVEKASFIQKPYTLDKLKQTVTELISK